jgi:hypothetical protein
VKKGEAGTKEKTSLRISRFFPGKLIFTGFNWVDKGKY